MTELSFFYYLEDWKFEDITLPYHLDKWLDIKFNAKYIIFIKCTLFNKLVFQNLYKPEILIFLNPIRKIKNYTFSYNFVKKYIFIEDIQIIENNSFFKNYQLEEIYVTKNNNICLDNKVSNINKSLEYLILIKLLKDKFKYNKVNKKIKLNGYFRNNCNRALAKLLEK